MCSKTNDCYFDLFKIANNSFQFRDAKVIMESELSRTRNDKVYIPDVSTKFDAVSFGDVSFESTPIV